MTSRCQPTYARVSSTSGAPSPSRTWNLNSGDFVFRELRADLVPAKALRNVLDLLTTGRLYKFTLPLVRRSSNEYG